MSVMIILYYLSSILAIPLQKSDKAGDNKQLTSPLMWGSKTIIETEICLLWLNGMVGGACMWLAL